MWSPSNTVRAGLTLVDMVISVLIVGIMAAVAVPRSIDTLHRYRANAAAERVLVDLELARKDAMSASAARTVRFSSTSYTLSAMSDLDRSRAVYAVDLAEPPYRSAVAAAALAGDKIIIFDGYGRPDSGGRVVIVSGGRQATVSVDAETGRASIP
ncbi:MAG: Tfp pilus assembly protein FimT/FimU [Planctomycetaceae bacterium]